MSMWWACGIPVPAGDVTNGDVTGDERHAHGMRNVVRGFVACPLVYMYPWCAGMTHVS